MSFRVSDRVSRVIYRTYAVGVWTGRLPRWKPDSPAAAWYCFFLFTKFWLKEPKFREQELVSSVLPEAISPVKRGIV